MRIFNDLSDLPDFRNAVITIGSFDGVHCGHQKILEKINNKAASIDGESVVITFHPHPRLVIFPNDKSLRLITTIDEKVKLFERYGVDNVIVVPFSVEFSQQSADEYIERFLWDKFKPHTIVIGYDHRFGRNRVGDINYLKWHGEKLGFEVLEIQKQEIESIAVSSTKVRQALDTGMVSEAAKLLGHRFSLTGLVVHGQHIGTGIGYPTANIEVKQKHKLVPPDGIYAVFAEYRGEQYRGMLYIGKRPSLKDHDHKSIEVNIFDFDKDIYNDRLKVEFVAYVRGEQSFNNLDELKKALAADKVKSTELLDIAEKKEAEANHVREERNLPEVAVVILNYNGLKYLEQYLPGVHHSDYPGLQIIIADNGSTDDSLNYVRKNFPYINILDLGGNHGFAGGYNRALKKVKADYYILLNSDVKATGNWIRPIIQQMDADPNIAAAQPKIKSAHDPLRFEYAGAAGGLLDKWAYPLCRGRVFDETEKDEGQYEEATEIFWASGAALFIKSEIFHRVGGFDADYFAHVEEIDLCFRIKRAGYKVMYYPDAEVFHVGGGTLNYNTPRKTYLNFRNSYFTLFKNEPKSRLWWLLPWRLILDGVAGVMFLFEGKFAHIRAIVKAHWDFFPRIAYLRKRRKFYSELVQQISIDRPNNKSGVVRKSAIIQFFLLRRKKFSEW